MIGSYFILAQILHCKLKCCFLLWHNFCWSLMKKKCHKTIAFDIVLSNNIYVFYHWQVGKFYSCSSSKVQKIILKLFVSVQKRNYD